MRGSRRARVLAGFAILSCGWGPGLGAADPQASVSARWDRAVTESRTAVSIQVCVEPPMRRQSPIHDQLYRAIKDLNVDYARYQPWRPYPRLTVAELEPPANGKASWDFSLLDPLLIDFMEAVGGRPVDVSISPIPQWMFKTDKAVRYPNDPDEITWNYEQGTELRDPTMKEVADYFTRVASWYTQGGFVDEFGRRHESGHKFKFDYWEVLNEVDFEHTMPPEYYTRVYDAAVEAVRKVIPKSKFMGMALTPGGALNPKWFEYFLDPKNHKAGIPVDAISYHFYATPAPDETPEIMGRTIFAQADGFLNVVRYIETIRKRLAPAAETFVNEIGTILPDSQALPMRPIPPGYWNISGAMFAYLFARLAPMGIDAIHESELIDYPGQYPGTSMVDWETGRPNPRYWVLKLLADHFKRGDRLVETEFKLPAPPDAGERPSERNYVHAQGFVTRDGKRKILLVNKRDRAFEIAIPEGAQVEYVDQTTMYEPPASLTLKSEPLVLKEYGVAVVTLKSL